ncbi:MAG: NERD domain-containing protein [Chloroflexi bacterium]|nr:MAG: NERD domain-containing protein [Chloroflexota bacterium]
MKAITNTDIIESRARWARRIAPLTLLFLIGGLITNFMSLSRPEYFQPTLLLLALGFVFATVSSYLTARWVREPRADQILSNLLKKFSNDFILFNYTGPAPHILLTPTRLYVIAVKQHDGKISVKGRRFARKFSWKLFFRYFADEGLGAPASETENGVNKVQKLLAQELSPEEMPEIHPLVLFTNKAVELDIDQPAVPVLRGSEFKTFIREENKQKRISNAQRQTITRLLGGQWA